MTLEQLVQAAIDTRGKLDTLLRAIEDGLGYDVDGLADKLEDFAFDDDGTLVDAPEED